jgi:hypothetical protein
MRVHVRMEVAGRSIDETVSGKDAADILSQAKARVAHELGWKGLFLHAMPTLTFAQEAVRRYNLKFDTQYDTPTSVDDFFSWGEHLGYITFLPE